MSIKILRKFQGKVPLTSKCVHENTKKECKYDGEVCACNVYAGDTTLPLLFEAR